MKKRSIPNHAVIRYLERYKGIDIEAVREEIEGLADGALPLRDGEHHWHFSGIVLILGKEGQVVTVLSKEQSAKFFGRKLKNGCRIGVPDAEPMVG